MNKQHISSLFDKDLEELDAMLLQLGNMALTQFVAVIQVMNNGDSNDKATDALVAFDAELDALEAGIHEKTIEIIALRSPQIEDLRRVITAPKIAAIFERIGDYACNIAKRRRLMQDEKDKLEHMDSLEAMSNFAQDMLTDALDAFKRRDAEKAYEVRQKDAYLDEMHSKVYQHILNKMAEKASLNACVNTLFIAKNIERIGDLCTSVAEQTHFIASGRMLTDMRPKSDITSDQ